MSYRASPTFAMLRYRFWRRLAPELPTRSLRDWAWGRKWALWHAIYGAHRSLWGAE